MAVVVAVLGGAFAASSLGLMAAVAAVALAPPAAHVWRVGWRRAITEPTPAAIIVLFYLAVFPQRALTIALGGYEDVLFVPLPTDGQELAAVLLLASVVTTAIVLGFHTIAKDTRPGLTLTKPRPVAALGFALQGLALAALLGVLAENGGPSGVIASFASHDTELATAARSTAYSLWITFAAPAIWGTALVMATPGVKRDARLLILLGGACICFAQIILFGSRLQMTLGLIGAWAVWYYAGRRVSPRAVAIAGLALVLVSIPVLANRGDGLTQRERLQPTHVRVSEIVGYGILDVSLAVQQRPERIERAWRCEECWTSLPWALIPFGPEPNTRDQLHTIAIVRAFGAPNQQNSGFPASTVTEAWIAGGWVLAPFWGLGLGLLAGWFHTRLVGRSVVTAAGLMFYALVVANSFTIFKDGNLNGAVVLVWRTTLYLAVPMLLTGVWRPSLGRARRVPAPARA